MPNVVASGLFGDGAAAVVGAGMGRDPVPDRFPIEVLDSRSRLYPDSERTMGFDVGASGLRIVLDARVPQIVGRYIRDDVDDFLADHKLTRADIGFWVCHPGGPKVIDAVRDALEVGDHDVERRHPRAHRRPGTRCGAGGPAVHDQAVPGTRTRPSAAASAMSVR